MTLEDLQFIVDYFRKEGRVIKRAPAAFVTACLVATCILSFIAYEFISHSYSREVASLRGATTQLDATIKSLEATVKYQETRILELSGKPPSIDRPTGVSRLQLVNTVLVTPDNPNGVNYYFKNVGSAPAIGFRHGEGALVAKGELPAKILDEIFSNLNSLMADVKKRTVESETQPDETIFYTQSTGNTDSSVKDAIERGELLYVMQIAIWKDSTVPPGKWRALETCMYVPKDKSFHKCETHNRIFLSD